MTHDDRLMEDVARLWVDRGGDADGIDWCYARLKSAIRAEIAERQKQQEIASLTDEQKDDWLCQLVADKRRAMGISE